ncbi:MAG TPA: FHA domain-containing protein [Thermosynechococcaceae cyanobacterium]
MSHFKHSSTPDLRTLSFLEENPSLSESLLADGHNLNQVVTLIQPVLQAPERCEISSLYIQAVSTGRTAFLTTNLLDSCQTHVTDSGTSWLLGRDLTCAIALQNSSISRCHAVIAHCVERGFSIMDVGSSNGTFVNRRRLRPQDPRFLKDGDLVELSNLRIEFFVTGCPSEVMYQETLV